MSIPYTSHSPYKLILNDDGTFQVQQGDSLSKYNWAIDGNWGNDTSWDRFRRPDGSLKGKVITPKSLIHTGETLLYLPDYKPKPAWKAPATQPAPSTQPISRPLTTGECDVLRSVYGSQIPYSQVRVHNYKGLPIQPNTSVMTPNGEMYWPAGIYQPDFSDPALPNRYREVLVHEGAHLYQYYTLGWTRAGFFNTGTTPMC
jgi:hypothetical protein